MINEYEKLLAGLDDVDWAGLSHAYGSAHDVPGHIRTLCGDDDEARKQAFNSLFNSIFHQGSRYSASPVAVPFLARIAVAGPAAARAKTMLLLTRLAVDWHDEYDVTTGINVAGWRAAAAEAGPEEFLPWYEEQLAGATDTDERAQLQEMRDWVAAGNSPDSRWSALQSYDAVLAELPGLLILLEETPVGPGLIGRAVTELTAAARSPFDRVTDYCEGDLHGHIQRTLRSLPPGSNPASVREALEACLPRIVWDSSGSRTRRAIQELFPAPLPHPAPRFADLTAAQQQLLGDLAGHLHTWLIRSSADRLRELGLPHTQEALQSYVGTHRTA
ncbi:hypothetical protein [Streptomyces anulatus]|uniref:hypothetical protein n=1 Tax=Streptomyces anulatus TaxID=1892 RepID=UPI00386D35A0|nr:hypothetical protein OG536_35540 [Streptomyces anulatus]